VVKGLPLPFAQVVGVVPSERRVLVVPHEINLRNGLVLVLGLTVLHLGQIHTPVRLGGGEGEPEPVFPSPITDDPYPFRGKPIPNIELPDVLTDGMNHDPVLDRQHDLENTLKIPSVGLFKLGVGQVRIMGGIVNDSALQLGYHHDIVIIHDMDEGGGQGVGRSDDTYGVGFVDDMDIDMTGSEVLVVIPYNTFDGPPSGGGKGGEPGGDEDDPGVGGGGRDGG